MLEGSQRVPLLASLNLEVPVYTMRNLLPLQLPDELLDAVHYMWPAL